MRDPSLSSLRPVVVLGAARSGTKLLRSIIAASPQYAAVPHDVNYVWRTLAPQHPNDALAAVALHPAKVARVRSLLLRMAGIIGDERRQFVEKTVSNTLRVPLVDQVLPDALYVHLVRDGRAVTESALRCWQSPPELRRLLDKLRTYPWRSCSRYAFAHVSGIAQRYLSGNRRLPVWGPAYPGIQKDLERMSLAEVCALQWRRTVEAARKDLSSIPADRWIEIRYEDLVEHPRGVAEAIASLMDVDPLPLVHFAVASIQPTSNRSISFTNDVQARAVEAILSPLREELGYATTRLAA